MTIDKIQKDYLYILHSAVKNIPLNKEKVENMDLSAIFKISNEQSQTELFYAWFQKNNFRLPEHLEKIGQRYLDHGIHREALMNAERERIYSYFDQNKIWHCSLKGILIQPLYPSLGTRYASDNDILVDPDKCREIKNFMKSRGYKTLHYGGKHDAYLKNPSYHFEMHRRLMDYKKGDLAAEYFNHIFSRLTRENAEGYLYRMTNEDFYLHMIIHMYIHYNSGGTGLRYLVDLYYVLNQPNYEIDWNYVKAKLTEFKMDDFEQDVRKLSQKLFDNEEICYELTETEVENLNHLFISGSHGKDENRIENYIKKNVAEGRTRKEAKKKYIVSRLFPDMGYYKSAYPFLYYFRIFIPIFLVYRVFRGLFINKTIGGEIKGLRKSNKGD